MRARPKVLAVFGFLVGTQNYHLKCYCWWVGGVGPERICSGRQVLAILTIKLMLVLGRNVIRRCSTLCNYICRDRRGSIAWILDA
jgi:hypothetical protein